MTIDERAERRRAQNRAWYQRNRDKLLAYHREYRAGAGREARRESSRKYKLKVRYNITPEMYAEMLAAQGGVCAICGCDPEGTALHVDHDHNCCPGKTSCGECVRGLLCLSCNLFIGRIREDPTRLLEYLRRFGWSGSSATRRRISTAST